MKTVAISLALGDIYSESGTGPLIQPIDGAVERFWSITDKISRNNDSLIICTAGYSKKFPTKPQPERTMSLAGQLCRYVTENEPEWLPYLFAKPRCWSTRNEIRLGIKISQQIDFASKDEEVTLTVASNLTHLVRIWLYMILYTPKNWKIKLVRAHHSFSLLSHILEPLKIARDIIYIVRVLKRLRKQQKFKSP